MEASPSETSTIHQQTQTIPSISHSLDDLSAERHNQKKINNISSNNKVDVHVRLKGRGAELFQKIQANKPLPYGWLATVVNRAVIDELEILARNRGLM